MTAAAAEYKNNIAPDFTLADAYDAEYVDVEATEDVSREERQALNARMAEWFGI